MCRFLWSQDFTYWRLKLGVLLWGCVKVSYLPFKKLPHCFSEQLGHLNSLQQCVSGPVFRHPYLHFQSLLFSCQPFWYVCEICLLVLIGICPMTNNVKYLYMTYFYVSPSWNVFLYLLFSNKIFFYCWLLSYLYILDTSLLADMCFGNITHSVICLLILLIGSFF